MLDQLHKCKAAVSRAYTFPPGITCLKFLLKKIVRWCGQKLELNEEKFSRVLRWVYNSQIMSEAEKILQEAEAQIPELARAATRAAHQKALADGNSVLIIVNGELRQITKDGSYQVIKKNPAYKRVQKGEIIKIR
jgi:hypothetical protein